MSKAKRPIFIPLTRFPYVKEIMVEFEWFSGFAISQVQKSIVDLHHTASQQGIMPILEISSKSKQSLGVSLSAFNLHLRTKNEKKISVECAFQGSKVFDKGGPYTDLYFVNSREAKTDPRIKNSGNVVAFNYMGDDFPTNPVTAFYDWLYLNALWQNPGLSSKLMEFNGFSDIAFNPKKSLNCQARSASLFVALYKCQLIESVVKDRNLYLAYITETHKPTASQLSIF